MDVSITPLRVDQPAHYQIKLLGRLSPLWAETLDDFTLAASVTDGVPPVTTLQARVADQSALFGLLSRLRDLGLPLLLVEYRPGDTPAIVTA